MVDVAWLVDTNNSGWVCWALVCHSLHTHPHATHTPAMVKVSSAQHKRAKFLILVLRGSSPKSAMKKLNIKKKTYVSDLVRLLEETDSLADAPRSGRPEKYGEDMLCKAKDLLLDLEDAVFCCKDAVSAMINEEILPDDTKWASFWPKLVKYLATQGLYLVWGIQRLTFAMNHEHVESRFEWCKQNEKEFTDRTMKNYVFVDEISLEFGGHPKGECTWGWPACA